ncbi:MAG: hypothetical protein RBS80_22915 [Thermoguttaceae bacterium]|jgi:hypothetical protein|nr:hypothetical protein [Thermoguttaceae bacterium]
MNRLIERWTESRPAGLLWLTAGLLLVAGCDVQPRLPVSGEVRFDGQPIEVGQIAFYPTSGSAATAVKSDIHHDRSSFPDRTPFGPASTAFTSPPCANGRRVRTK